MSDTELKSCMTLDEAIEHCKEKADCTKCGMEHRQLAEWLIELENRRNDMERIVELVPSIEDIVHTYEQPPYGREVQGTVELLEEILGIVKGGAKCAMYQKEHLMQKPRNIMDWWEEYMEICQMGV
ncbi:hypothetical protein [[Clostridium] scindens]|uniref:hypothetical protein n=2 Tax=Clostridium scindens (strain JCM 10418 / VPI 12708) TaxID=29347 RepID=UPI003AF1598C